MIDPNREFDPENNEEYSSDNSNNITAENGADHLSGNDAGEPAAEEGNSASENVNNSSWNSREQDNSFGGFANSRYIGYKINDFDSQTGWQDGPVPKQPTAPETGTGKKMVGIVIAGVLFGIVAGGTMFAVNHAAQNVFGSGRKVEASAPAVQETAPAVTREADSSAKDIPSVSGGSVSLSAGDVSDIVEQTIPSVVAINTKSTFTQHDWFFGSQTYRMQGSGSGIIVAQNDNELLLISNNHVVDDSEELTVTFHDGTSVQAAIKGTDPSSDLAVVAVQMADIPEETKGKIKIAVMGDSDSLKLGETVIAIGNALGEGMSVTRGVVSVLNKTIPMQNGTTRTLIQVDAAINPGNSGGALLNMKGELVGINSAKYSKTDIEGVGFAIPISKAKTIIDDLMTKKTKVEVPDDEKAYLGIQLSNIDSVTARNYNLPEGVYVFRVIPGFGAAQSDLRERDIIVKLNGESVKTGDELHKLLGYYRGGETVKLTVMREDENRVYQETEVEVTLSFQKDADRTRNPLH